MDTNSDPARLYVRIKIYITRLETTVVMKTIVSTTVGIDGLWLTTKS